MRPVRPTTTIAYMSTDPAGIAARVQRLYREIIDPVAERFAFERAPASAEVGGPPMVLLVGNHSSGKSTFINHLLGEEVQSTGLAPTDDAFTVLAWGEQPGERDGRAIATDPDLPFGSLGHFGPTFLSHFRRRARPVPLLKDVTLVDTPGMIDAAREEWGRGYDFTGVVRWFAERAELVLVFFDPDKPGTTGETLDVFTKALTDLAHKVRIVLNKVDQLRGIEDFARAYGALCWNLAKVLPRKDLPLIYTTYVPVEDAPPARLPLGDFDRSRQRLQDDIGSAPERRADTMVTHLAEHAARLTMHVRVIDAAVAEARAERWRVGLRAAGATLAALLLALATLWGDDRVITAGAITVALLLGVVAFLLARRALGETIHRITHDPTPIFERIHGRELLIRNRAEDLRALWAEVKPRTTHTLRALGPLSFPRLKKKEQRDLDRIRAEEVPALRRAMRPELPVPEVVEDVPVDRAANE